MPTKDCEMYGKSIRKENFEQDFSDLITSISPPKPIFDTAAAMLEDWWEDIRKNYNINALAHEQESTVIDNKIAKLVERVLEANSTTLVSTYENAIRELENRKAYLNDKSKELGIKPAKFKDTFRTSMKFLENPSKTWASGDIVQKRTTLKMLFKGKLQYTKNEGFRTPETASPIRLCGTLATGDYEMVPAPRVELGTY